MFNRKGRKCPARFRLCLCTLVAMTLGWSDMTARAGLTSITFDIQAQSSLGSGSFQLTLSQTNFNSATDTWWWNAPSSISILDDINSNLLATINSASFTYVQDPEVNFGFTVTAGTADTVFTIGLPPKN